MEMIMLIALGASLVAILGLICCCSHLNTKNLQLKCENEILNREAKQYSIAARKLLDKLENK
ncbi:hypothetical protein [Salmonella phage GSW6]|uniref:Uncharacterized protein n=1 Tax=Salmonella phage GSW6 TaxID=3025422 RepID=A0AAE9YH61_9CAUD|nr:hypothetical protein [Salmonella phage GSW6]